MAVYLNALALGGGTLKPVDWAAFLIDISKRISDCLLAKLLCRQLQLKRMLNGSDMTARPSPGSDKMNYGRQAKSAATLVAIQNPQSQSQKAKQLCLMCPTWPQKFSR